MLVQPIQSMIFWRQR